MSDLNRPYDFVPEKIIPMTRHINCPVSEEIKVNKYKVLTDGDFINDTIYLELGYDDKSEYDSSFFLKSSDLRTLATNLLTLADAVEARHKLYSISREWLDGIKKQLQDGYIKSLHIYPKYIYCTDIHDDLFSTIVFEVGYTKTDDNDYKSALVLSDSMIMNTKDYLLLQTRNLQEKYPQLSVLEIDNNKFKKLMKKIHDYKVDQLQPTVEPMKPKASVQDLINGYLTSKGENKDAE